MDLVIDANILFSVLIKKGKTEEIIFKDTIHLFAPRNYLLHTHNDFYLPIREENNYLVVPRLSRAGFPLLIIFCFDTTQKQKKEITMNSKSLEVTCPLGKGTSLKTKSLSVLIRIRRSILFKELFTNLFVRNIYAQLDFLLTCPPFFWWIKEVSHITLNIFLMFLNFL